MNQRIRSICSKIKSYAKRILKTIFYGLAKIGRAVSRSKTLMFLLFWFLIFLISVSATANPNMEHYRGISIFWEPLYTYDPATRTLEDISLNPDEVPVDESTKTIAWVKLYGPILDSCGSAFVTDATDVICASETVDFLTYLRLREDIAGIFIELNSPGGSQYASDLLFQTLHEISQKIPVYIYVPDLLASGGVYVAAGANKVILSPIAMVGNIGVVFEFLDTSGLEQKIGVRRVVFHSNDAKYKTLQGLLDEDRTDPEDKALQEILDLAEDRFHQVLLKGRPTVQLDKVKNGLIFTAPKGVEYGLADAIRENPKLALLDLLKSLNTHSRVEVYEFYFRPKTDWLSEMLGVNLQVVSSWLSGAGVEYYPRIMYR